MPRIIWLPFPVNVRALPHTYRVAPKIRRGRNLQPRPVPSSAGDHRSPRHLENLRDNSRIALRYLTGSARPDYLRMGWYSGPAIPPADVQSQLAAAFSWLRLIRAASCDHHVPNRLNENIRRPSEALLQARASQLPETHRWSLIGRTDGPVVVFTDALPGLPADIDDEPRLQELLAALTAAAQRASR